MIKTIIKENYYMDSIFLMNASREIIKIEGIEDTVVVMGTDMNKTVLDDFGGLTADAAAASPNDLIISLRLESEEIIKDVWTVLDKLMSSKSFSADEKETSYISLDKAAETVPDANLAVISLPGEFAAYEAKKALSHDMNVFIFSDNVPLKEEVELKMIAKEKGLWVMGPGCGTSVINNISLGLMSKVRTGCIGIVGASGSGIHEIAMLVHRYGMGVSQAIGTGGRDLSKDVGGMTMMQGINYLEKDDDTKVIVLVSKPPHPDTAKKIFNLIGGCKKSVVVFFLGGNATRIKAAGAYCPETLEDAAQMAVKLARGEAVEQLDFVRNCKKEYKEMAAEEKKRLRPEQKYMRALFCGGTHSEEAVIMLQDFVPNLHSNIKFGKVKLLDNPGVSIENSLVDMGDEEFTKGKPHPVMDPSILCDRLMEEGSYPEVGVILFDLLLGYGVHKDPVGTIEGTLASIREKTAEEGRYVSLIASICGTDLDPQGIDNQRERLEALGVKVLPSNSKAAIVSGLIVS